MDTTFLRIFGVSACIALAAVTAKAEEVNSETAGDDKSTPSTVTPNAEPTINAHPAQQRESHTETQPITALSSTPDLYGGISINMKDIPTDGVEFQQRLEASLALWTTQGKRGVWLTIPMEQVDLVPIAVKLG